jgi:hypothetical protein
MYFFDEQTASGEKRHDVEQGTGPLHRFSVHFRSLPPIDWRLRSARRADLPGTMPGRRASRLRRPRGPCPAP